MEVLTKENVKARAWVLVTAIVLDVVVLGAFLAVKAQSDPLVLGSVAVGLIVIFGGEWWFLRVQKGEWGSSAPL